MENKNIFIRQNLNQKAGNNLFLYIIGIIGISILLSYITLQYIYILPPDAFIINIIIGTMICSFSILIIVTIYLSLKIDKKIHLLVENNYETQIKHKGYIKSIKIDKLYAGRRSFVYNIFSGIRIIIISNIDNNNNNNKNIKFTVEVLKYNLPKEIQIELKDSFFNINVWNNQKIEELTSQRLESKYNLYTGKEVTIFQNPDDINDLLMRNPFEMK